MSLIKLGEAVTIHSVNIHTADSVLADTDILSRMSDDSNLLSDFRKFATELKQIAPKAKDFLYFSAIMMHAAEAALLDGDGKFKKDAGGNEITASWEKKGESWRWTCTDPSIRPYKNSNNDIFPEEELIKAHKNWVGRPLCLDHKSSSVDMIRGLVVDTYYDRANKRVIALCALDKVNYPDLARKVSTGYATSVSMGTAVGRAICTDCGQVARVEADFCDHMRKKSCYGEINVDLNPIELSIVVNGADPKAKIRHIVAAADSIARYVEMKKEQFSKLAEDETRDIELASEIREGLERIDSEVLGLKQKIDQLKGNEEAEQSRQQGQPEPPAAAANDGAVATQTVEASNNDLTVKVASVLDKLEQLDQKINKLSVSNISEENEMTNKKGFYQGAGGPNEPTPGKPKYEKEDSESIRANQDKQMNQTGDLGSVESLFPGDEEKKRALQRIAEAEERALKRQAALRDAKEALEKGAYMQGGGGANEPTPGKAKYPKEDAEKIREKDDKQMNGAPPFPGVGKIDGLYPTDLEEKKRLLRAKLTAKFVKAAKPSDGTLDQGESRWQVYADDKLILTATVNEITGNKAASLYNSVATKEFGKELLAKIKTEGFDKAASLFKGAQDPMMAAPPPAADAGAPAPAAPMPGGDAMPDAMTDAGDSGNPVDTIGDLSHQLNNLAADLAQAHEALTNTPSNELQDYDQLAGATPELPVAASTQALIQMQKKLSSALQVGIKQTLLQIEDHVKELKLSKSFYVDEALLKKASSERKAAVDGLVADACNDAKRTIADAYKLMGAFVKYARGTETLVKRAKSEIDMVKNAQFKPSGLPGDPLDPTLPGAKAPVKAPGAPYTAPKPVAPKKPATQPNGLPLPYGDRSALETMLINNTREAPGSWTGPAGKAPKPSGQNQADDMETGNEEVQSDSADVKMNPDGSMEGTPEEVGKAMKEKSAASTSEDTKEARAAARAKMAETGMKLAEKGVQFSDMIGKAHPQGGFTTQLDTTPSNDLAKVETIVEVHDKMMDVATAPPRVRKMAEEIQKYVVAGKIDPAKDFPALVAQGLDPAAVTYWKKMWSPADGGSEFSSELVKEHTQKKAAEEKEAYKVKVARAYALAYEMAEREMIGRDTSSINTQVTEILNWNDDNYESLKRVVLRQPMAKKASAMPQVGMIGTGDVLAPPADEEPTDFANALAACFANKRY